ncbi:MAG: aromatic-ring-hydroxylating dioxygenase subunit beta [Sphingomonas sp.]
MTALGQDEAAAYLYREALLLDRMDFDGWLALYTADCLFWMPAWRDDGTQTDDPERELSLIYYRGRRNLEDRIQRIRSGFSVASVVMPRVAHMVGNVLAEAVDEATMRLDSRSSSMSRTSGPIAPTPISAAMSMSYGWKAACGRFRERSSG